MNVQKLTRKKDLFLFVKQSNVAICLYNSRDMDWRIILFPSSLKPKKDITSSSLAPILKELFGKMLLSTLFYPINNVRIQLSKILKIKQRQRKLRKLLKNIGGITQQWPFHKLILVVSVKTRINILIRRRKCQRETYMLKP